MMTNETEWEQRLARLWAGMDDNDPDDFLAKIQALVSELPSDSAIGMFELAGANDSTGHPEKAAPLYRQALTAGLSGSRRRQAVIQLASTLRNLGHIDESLNLLSAERAAGSDELDDAVIAFMALALVDAGREKEAVAMTVTAIARHLTRYSRSLTNYAKDLSDSL
jgi:hypothetical protein